MGISRYIYLASNFPDEGLEDEHDWIEYPGRIVAAVLSQTLRRLGCEVDSVCDEDFKGWEFNFTYRGVRMWARVGAIEDFLIVLVLPGWFDPSGRKKRVFAQLIERLDELLHKDGRFSNIRWYTQKQMDAGEWDHPGKNEAERPGA